MASPRSRAVPVVDALVSAGLVDAGRRAEAHRVVRAALEIPATKASLRARLVELAAYVGGALVVSSIGLFLAQYWADFSAAVQVSVIALIAMLLTFAGLAVSHLGPGYRAVRDGRDDVRRRLVSALLTAAAGAAGIAVGRLVDLQTHGDGNESWPIVAGAATALVLAALAYSYAPSLLGQVAMAGAVLMVITGGWTLLDEEPTDAVWPGLAFMAVGIAWLVCAESSVFREVVGARAIGSAVTLFGAQFTLVSADHAVVTYLLTLLVAAAGFVMYLREASWPYLLTGVVGTTLVVPEAIIDWTGGSLGPAGGVLVAGVTLLGASLAGLRVRKGATEEQPGP